ncbi:hypothetical protein DMENIID0001_169260 [Sergentomyia squamirostris]
MSKFEEIKVENEEYTDLVSEIKVEDVKIQKEDTYFGIGTNEQYQANQSWPENTGLPQPKLECAHCGKKWISFYFLEKHMRSHNSNETHASRESADDSTSNQELAVMDVDEDVSSAMKIEKGKRRPWLHKKNQLKEKVAQGLEHVTGSGKVMKGKTFTIQLKCCKKNCASKIDSHDQQCIFKAFYNLQNSGKTAFIRKCVERKNVMNRVSDRMPIIPEKIKTFNYVYNLKDQFGIRQVVCKTFFFTLLHISHTKVSHALNTAISNPACVEKRGTHVAPNKTPEDDVAFVRNFIENIPAYESNNSRQKRQKKNLSPVLSFAELHRKYTARCKEMRRKPVSIGIFTEIFKSDFNPLFKEIKENKIKKHS